MKKRAKLYIDLDYFLAAVTAIKNAGGATNISHSKLIEYVFEHEDCVPVGVEGFQTVKRLNYREDKDVAYLKYLYASLMDISYNGVKLNLVPAMQDNTEKQIDVMLSCEALANASSDKMDVAIVFTGDSDYIPLVKRLHEFGKETVVVSVIGHGVYCSDSLRKTAMRNIDLSPMLLKSNEGVSMREIISY